MIIDEEYFFTETCLKLEVVLENLFHFKYIIYLWDMKCLMQVPECGGKTEEQLKEQLKAIKCSYYGFLIPNVTNTLQ